MNLMFWRHKSKIMRGLEEIAEDLTSAASSFDQLDDETKKVLSDLDKKSEQTPEPDLK